MEMKGSFDFGVLHTFGRRRKSLRMDKELDNFIITLVAERVEYRIEQPVSSTKKDSA